MFKRFKYLLSPVMAVFGIALMTSCANAQVGSYTTCLTLFKPTPNAAANRGTWGPPVNVDFDIIDQASAGVLALNLPMQAGYPTVTLTSTSGAVDQSKNAHFNFTGVLTGNTTVLWPQNLCRTFTVANNTTGAFTLTIGANNGSGAAAGTTVAVPAGATLYLYSDGTNIANASYLALTGGTLTGNLTINTPSGSQGIVQFSSSGVVKYQFGKATDDSFFLYDAIHSQSVFSEDAAGNTSFGLIGRTTTLNGTVTATTPATSDNSTTVPTTAYVQSQFTATQSLASPGYQKFPGGLIMEWGTITTSASLITGVTFPLACPTALLSAQATWYAGAGFTGNFANINQATATAMDVTTYNTLGNQVAGTAYWSITCH